MCSLFLQHIVFRIITNDAVYYVGASAGGFCSGDVWGFGCVIANDLSRSVYSFTISACSRGSAGFFSVDFIFLIWFCLMVGRLVWPSLLHLLCLVAFDGQK